MFRRNVMLPCHRRWLRILFFCLYPVISAWPAVKLQVQCLRVDGLHFAPHLFPPVPRRAGSEIIQHEVSVPSFTVMLGSCLCFAVAEAGRIVLVTRLSPTMQAALDGSFMVMLGVAACMVRCASTCAFACKMHALVAHWRSQERRASPLW